ncbi:MAG: FecR domain-containing protein [Ruminococcus sp.]|nr:FecR domain-containing protein [Ruminococcus sp.]
MKKISQFLAEHALVLVIAAIAFVSLILITIVVTLATSGNSDRKIIIDDISGNAFILKTDGQIPATSKMRLASGDVIITSPESTVKLSVDKDKYIYVEPNTTLYVYYTETSEKGSIVVNISEGAAISRLDSALPKNTAFEVRTPNSVVSVTGTVFRTEFKFYETYGIYSQAKVTEVQCADGNVNIQLYDDNAVAAEKLMLLTENKSARLVTAGQTAQYEYLNSDTDIFSFSEDTLKTYIRIAAERKLGYSLSSLNAAYQSLLNTGLEIDTSISTIYPVEESDNFSTAEITTSPLPSFTVSAPSDVSDTDLTDGAEQTAESSRVFAEDTQISSVSTAPPEETASSAISVTSPTKKIYTVSTPEETAESTFGTTSPPDETAVSETAAPVPDIIPAETVTASYTQSETTPPPSETTTVTTPPSEEPDSQTTTTPPQTTVPWWEIVNSAALS